MCTYLSNIFFLLFLVIAPFAVIAEDRDPKFDAWVIKLAKDAKAKGISQNTLDNTIPHIRLVPNAVKLDKKQPYKTLRFTEYRNKVLTDSKINKAKKLYKKHEKLLIEIGEHYNVQPRFIIALWGVESNFGGYTGNFSIINTLATLAYDGRRSKFFRSELLHALSIIDDGHISYEDMKGSWAGAMGQTQFMPSSFISYAVDYDNDGKRDIWNTKSDIFASIANYLSKRNWDYHTNWGRKIRLPKDFNYKLASTKITKPLENWEKLGITKFNGTPLPNRKQLRSSIVVPDKEEKEEAFLVYDNYKTLLKWNRSLYFATVVGIFADNIH